MDILRANPDVRGLEACRKRRKGRKRGAYDNLHVTGALNQRLELLNQRQRLGDRLVHLPIPRGKWDPRHGSLRWSECSLRARRGARAPLQTRPPLQALNLIFQPDEMFKQPVRQGIRLLECRADDLARECPADARVGAGHVQVSETE